VPLLPDYPTDEAAAAADRWIVTFHDETLDVLAQRAVAMPARSQNPLTRPSPQRWPPPVDSRRLS